MKKKQHTEPLSLCVNSLWEWDMKKVSTDFTEKSELVISLINRMKTSKGNW